MTINREEAKKWSKERIHEEIRDLRRYISEFDDDINNSLEEERELEREERERQERMPYAKERTFDGSYARDNLRSAILRNEEDMEFLKSLLDGNPNISSDTIRQNVSSPENSRQNTYIMPIDQVVYTSPQTRVPCGRPAGDRLPTIGDEIMNRPLIAGGRDAGSTITYLLIGGVLGLVALFVKNCVYSPDETYQRKHNEIIKSTKQNRPIMRKTSWGYVIGNYVDQQTTRQVTGVQRLNPLEKRVLATRPTQSLNRMRENQQLSNKNVAYPRFYYVTSK